MKYLALSLVVSMGLLLCGCNTKCLHKVTHVYHTEFVHLYLDTCSGKYIQPIYKALPDQYKTRRK